MEISPEPSRPDRKTKADKRLERHEAKRQKEEMKRGAPLKPRTPKQAELIRALDTYPVVFALGPAGTGKTYVAARHALAKLLNGKIEKIAITRPTVSATRHKLGYQPGGVSAKLKPWLTPVLDAFYQGLAAAQVDRMMQNREIECLGFEFMRGMTIRDGCLILDEAQNCTIGDLEMVVTRMGDGGQLVICGDPHQNDLGNESGLNKLAAMVSRYGLNAGVVEFTEDEVVRSETAAEWVKAFKAMRDEGKPTRISWPERLALLNVS